MPRGAADRVRVPDAFPGILPIVGRRQVSCDACPANVVVIYALSNTFTPAGTDDSNAPTSFVAGEGLSISDLFEHPGDCPRKEGEILFDDIPDPQGIDAEVLVHEDIPKPGDAPPVDLRMVCFQVFVETACVDSARIWRFRRTASCIISSARNASFPPRVYLAIRSVHSLM